jgi:FkbM family methyltransferase
MHLFTVNKTPLMTGFLVGETRLFQDDPVVILDVGARGGLGLEWVPFGDQVRAYCFEPDEEECRRLAAAAPPNQTYISRALGKASGRQTLYKTALPNSSGLYKTRMDYFSRLLNRENGMTMAEVEVEVSSLDEAMAEYNIPPVDFIKLDVEGAELDILEGAEALLAGGQPLGLVSEIRFHKEINASPPFSRFDLFLRDHGFHLYDLQFYYQSRVALPYPGLERYRRPNGTPFYAYTSRGQLQDGDALYFRDLLLPGGKPLINDMPAVRVLKLCAFFEIFSMNDCAAELILACRDRVDRLVDSTRLLDLLATGMAGATTTFRDYVERYFRQQPVLYEGPSLPAPAARGWRWRRG